MKEMPREVYDVDSENVTLGTIINSPDHIDKVKPYINTTILSEPRNRAVWKLLLNMQKSETPIDLPSICSV